MFQQSVKNELLLSLCLVSFFSSHAKETVVIPKIFIRTITNNTPYNVKLTDRLAQSWLGKKEVILKSGETTSVNYQTSNSNDIVIFGRMSDIMGKDAQFLLQRLNEKHAAEENKESYLNITASEGGINRNGFISGRAGTVTTNFNAASKDGGCTMNSGSIKTKDCTIVYYDITIEVSEKDHNNDIFRVQYSEQHEEN